MECIYYWGKGYTNLPLYLRASTSDIGMERTLTHADPFHSIKKSLQHFSIIELGIPIVTHQLYRWNDD